MLIVLRSESRNRKSHVVLEQVMNNWQVLMREHDDLDVLATKIQAHWRDKIARRKIQPLTPTDHTLQRVLSVRACCASSLLCARPQLALTHGRTCLQVLGRLEARVVRLEKKMGTLPVTEMAQQQTRNGTGGGGSARTNPKPPTQGNSRRKDRSRR